MDFITKLHNNELLFFDGAMGSLLAAKGANMQSGANNLAFPEIVEEVHREYISAGADCIITNSLTLNNISAAKKGFSIAETDDCVKAAVEIALKAADGKAFVFGDMGPTGLMLKPYGIGDPEQTYEAYCHQAQLLAAYPITGFIIETVFHLPEAMIMLKACRDTAPKLPVIVSMTFANTKNGGRTMMGDKSATIAEQAKAGGAAAVGANCGDLTPAEYAIVIAEMAKAGLPLIVQPNAGKPQLRNQEVFYPLAPQEFAAEMQECYNAGAKLLGGCCGTTPDHIRAIKSYIKHN